MNAREKIFTACALGGGIGAFLAHQLFYPSGWSILLGFLLGGLVSYLAYDFKEFLAAIPRAWRKTVDGMSDIVSVFAVLAVMATNVLVVWGVNALNLSVETTGLLQPILALTLMAGMMANMARWVTKDQYFDVYRSPREVSIFVIKRLNPFTNFLVGVPLLIFWTIKYSILFLPRFVWNVFVLIHSELRLLCLLDGGMGAVAGTLIASTLAGTLVGALAGGIFGVLDFEIVSKRLLKLVPTR